MCCSLDDGAPREEAEECCGIEKESQCDSREHCIWYQILPENEKHFDLIIKAYPKREQEPEDKDPAAKKAKIPKYRLTCNPTYGGQKVRVEPKEGAW